MVVRQNHVDLLQERNRNLQKSNYFTAFFPMHLLISNMPPTKLANHYFVFLPETSTLVNN